MKTIKLSYNGQLYEFVTIGELAKATGRSLSVIRKMIIAGKMPDSNLRLATLKTRKGEDMRGARIYSKQLAEDLVVIIKTFRQGIPITPQQRLEINAAFEQEKIKLKL